MNKDKYKKKAVIGVIGVCGINGNLIARILSDYGYRVIANDMQSREECRFKSALLEYSEIEIIHGDVPEEFFEKIDHIVLPTALIESKSELYRTVTEKNIPIITVQDILDKFEPIHPVICITGTNGKTTTTALLKKIAYAEDIFPSEHHLEGMQGNIGDIPALQTRLKCDVNIIETGTFGSEGSLKKLAQPCKPDVGLITNITPDHLDKSKNFKSYAKVKGELIYLLADGTLIINNDDPTIKYLVEENNYTGNLITFGLEHDSTKKAVKECLCGQQVDIEEYLPGCGKYECVCGLKYTKPDYLAHDINESHDAFILRTPTDEEYEFKLSVNGIHNIYNAVGAIIVANEIFGIDFERIREELQQFRGVSGRMEKIGETGSKEVMVDYAHNPAGTTAVLEELKNTYPKVVNLLTVSSESGISADMEILKCALEYADYVVPSSHNTYVCAKELLKDNQFKEKIILPDKMPKGDKTGTLGATEEQVLTAFSKALEIDADLIVCTGEAAFKFKDQLLKFMQE